MNQSAAQFINSFFDFEFDDQPDTLGEYGPMIAYLWTTAQQQGRVGEVRAALEALLASPEDPTLALDSMFLPGKHDVRDLLRLALQGTPDRQPEAPLG